MKLTSLLRKNKFVLLVTFSLSACQPAPAPENSGPAPAPVSNSQPNDINPVILISIDGFRFDYLDKYHSPHLNALAQSGVRAERMHPVYPSKTFPNHISMVTGMYPKNHGLVHNTFYDQELDDVYKMGKARKEPRWIQATPLWTLAEKNNLRAATYFWPESDAKLDGVLPSYFYPYDKSTPYQKRINQIIDWLKLPVDERPAFITGYFSLVDSQGHDFGPDSKQVSNAVTAVDGYIGQLKQRLDNELNFPVNLVVVSDHGMVEINANDRINWKSLANFDQFTVVNGYTQLMLYAKSGTEKQTIEEKAEQLSSVSQGRYTTYSKTQWPENLHYNNNPRIADITLESTPPATFRIKPFDHGDIGGAHGFNPYTVPQMGAIFIASGPNFKRGMVIPAFENIHVFPAIAHILKLPVPVTIDGQLEVLTPFLQ